MPDNDRLPHRFTPSQVDILASVIGDHMDLPEAQSINAEIGVAPTRALISDIQSRMLNVLEGPGNHIVLMLNDAECEALLKMDIPDDIRTEIGHVLP